MSDKALKPPPTKRRLNPHVMFWFSTALVVVNVILVFVAPLSELRVQACTNAGLCGISALLFWALSNKAES